MIEQADVSRRINAERLLLVAWVRAILLQLAHPLIAAGVSEHSTFRGSSTAAFNRLHHTVGAMLALTFGTPAQRAQALDAIRAIHRRVNGTLTEACGAFPAGTRYSAEDPELLLWVHATLVESIVIGYEQMIGPLHDAERDQYCADSAAVAVELGARPDEVPRSWPALRAYLDAGYASGRIAVGPQARALAAALTSPFSNTVARRLVTPLVSLLAAGQLPGPIRLQYGFAWDPTRQRRYSRIMRLLQLLRRVAPARAAIWKGARSVNCFTVRDGYSATAR